MNAILAKNVRTVREFKHWTQQHLADTSGVQLRTIQRVEKGDGASIDTLQALAAAFDSDVGTLQTDWSAVVDKLEKEQEALKKTHHIVQITPVKASADLNVIGGATGAMYQCLSDDDAVQDAFAALQSNMHDCIDIWSDVDPTSQREFVCGLYSQVQDLEKLGMVVGTGTRPSRWGTMPISILYVVAMPKDDVRLYIAHEKGPIKVADS